MHAVKEYLERVPKDRRARLEEIIAHIQKLYPKAELTLWYKMPTLKLGKAWIAVANQKHYVSVYTCAEAHIAPYKARHPQTRAGKGCLNFRDRDEIVLDDLTTVISSALSKPRH
jgi:uncharacterized protein YdhG (YjbR/CyaY superfamily)